VPASLSTTIAAQFAWAPTKAWASTTTGVAEYAARAVVWNRTPLGMAEDLAEFARVATLREKPTWAHDAPEPSMIPEIAALEHCSELTAAHSDGSVVLVQRGFEFMAPAAVSASRHANSVASWRERL
jgi:hypothetical protein